MQIEELAAYLNFFIDGKLIQENDHGTRRILVFVLIISFVYWFSGAKKYVDKKIENEDKKNKK